jgi:hypothetical protein
MNAYDGNGRILRAPIHIGDFVEAGERQAENRSSMLRLELALRLSFQRARSQAYHGPLMAARA